MRKLTYFSLAILLIACNTPKQKGLVYYNDFESMKGWAPICLSKKIAHSGIYSNQLDSIEVYGATFRRPFFDISKRRVMKVKVSFWAYLTPNAKGKLVVDVKNKNSKLMFWTGVALDTLIHKPNEWQKAETEIAFSYDSINAPQNIVSVYPWNLSKSEFYIDDFRLEFVVQN